ncbi:MAG: hypothetical protein A2X58_09595 [Nitrospirae bacterium GWC2_56_14]|nr:MAG: hypothetical protein A2X58_09595 [Nitrospirae bacterium GWC2_56_14]
MNSAVFQKNKKTPGKTSAGRSMVPFLIVSTIVSAVLAGPLLCEGSIALAQSAYRLVGTIEGGPFTGAVIDDTKNPQAFYRLNDKLPDESRLVKVLHNRIVLKMPDGTNMELYTTSGPGGGKAFAAPVAAVPSVAPQQIDRQKVDVQNAQVQDPPKRRVSSKYRRSRSRSAEEE